MNMIDPFELKDSGERQEFPTGSRRDTRDGKGRYDLISPIALERMALLMERGAKKYGERNREKGQPLSRFLDSAVRHLMEHLAGHRDEDHVIQAAWNCFALVHTEVMILRGRLPLSLADLHGDLMPVAAPAPKESELDILLKFSSDAHAATFRSVAPNQEG